jgi:hypothetical protein
MKANGRLERKRGGLRRNSEENERKHGSCRREQRMRR